MTRALGVPSRLAFLSVILILLLLLLTLLLGAAQLLFEAFKTKYQARMNLEP